MNDNDTSAAHTRPASAEVKGCPICGRPLALAYRPFCSKRCADLDLSRWLNGVYAVPAHDTDEADEGDTR